MSNWTAFLAEFTGTYNTIAQELRDDSAITDVESFHQLRTLIENDTLKEKFAALSSTGTGFLHEWATFLNAEKSQVSVGSQSNEPDYSQNKWAEFKAEFNGDYDFVIQGLRDDIKYSYFQNWSEYVDDFGAAYEPLVAAIQNDETLGFAEFSDFLGADQNEIHSLLMTLNSASSTLDELANLLDAKKSGLSTESSWIDFKNNFSLKWQPIIDQLEVDLSGMTWSTFYSKSIADHKLDLANSGDQVYFEIAQVLINYRDSDWEKFLALSITELRDKLALLDVNSAFFAEYTSVLALEMNDLISLYDKIIDEYDEGDRTVIADLLEYIQTTASGGISNFEDFLDKSENDVSGYLTDFIDTTEGEDFVDHVASGIQNAAINAFSGCTNTNEREQLFYENINSDLLDGFDDFYNTMVENTTVTNLEDLKTSKSEIETDLKALPCSHPFIHNLAKTLQTNAGGMIPKYTYSFRFHGKLMDDETIAEPVADMTAELVDTVSNEVISTASTEDNGRFFLHYNILHEKQVLPATQTFDIVIRNDSEELIHTASDVTITVNSDTATTVTITRPSIEKPDSATITDIFIDHPSISLPSALATFLTAEAYTLLFDVRSIGGLNNHDFTGSDPFVDSTDSAVKNAIQLIDQHSSLDSINPDSIYVNQKLIDAGYKNLGEIAKSLEKTFATDTSSFLSENQSRKLFNASKKQDVIKEAIISSLVVGKQYNSPLNDSIVGNIWGEDWEEIERKLSLNYKNYAFVPEEESVVSPLAYLYDLISYITTNFKDGTTAIDIAFLEDSLHQRFSDLTGSASAVGKKVNRTRAMVEIMRRYLIDNAVSTNDDDFQYYLKKAYRIILTQLNIDYRRLGQVINGTADQRTEFADNNNITTDGINAIYFDLSSDTAQLSEENLAETFGIKDTKQPPLATGTKITSTDSANDILEWQINNVQYLRDTDAQGYVYLSISKTIGSPDEYSIKVYKESGETNLIASGSVETDLSSGIIYLGSENQSTLQGFVKFSYHVTDKINIKISIIPLYTAARLGYLYSKWADFDSDDLLIDPDILLPDDMLHSLEHSFGAMKLWIERKDDLIIQSNLIKNHSSSTSTAEVYALSIVPTSIGMIEDTLYKVDTTNKIQVGYNGGSFSAFSSANVGASPGHLRSKNINLYLAEGGTSEIHQYITSGGDHETAANTDGNIIYSSANSSNLKFKDLSFNPNGKILVGSADTTNAKDYLIEFSPAVKSRFNGDKILWDNEGNSYVLNSIAPSIIKYDPSGSIVSSYGHSVDNELHYYKLNSVSLVDENTTTSGEIIGTVDDVVTGKFGSAVPLDGDQNSINLDDLSSINSMSLSFWVNIDNVNKKDLQLIASIAKDSNKGIAIYAEQNHLYLSHWCHDGSEYLLDPVTIVAREALIQASWHHIAITYSCNSDGSLTEGGLKLFQDGENVGSVDSMKMDGTIETFLGLDAGKTLATHHFNPTTELYGQITSSNALKGSYDEVKMFDRAITPTECNALYDSSISQAISNPTAFALNSKNEVFVLDASNGKINVFENTGDFKQQINLANFSGGEKFPAIAIDYQDYIYVADQDDGLIQVLNSDGVAQADITGFSEIRDIHIDADNRLYVADTNIASPGDSEVSIFDLISGVATTNSTIEEAKTGSNLTKPSGVTTDQLGRLYITDDGGKRIIQYDKSHNYVNEWGGADNFMWNSLNLSDAMGQVSISSTNRIFFALGEFGVDDLLCETYMPQETELEGTGGKLNSLVVNKRDEVFVSLTADDKIVRYNPETQILSEICSGGSGSGNVSAPKQLAIDGFDRIYIADSGNNLVQIVDRTGEFLRELSTATALTSSSHTLTGLSSVALNPNLLISVNGEDNGTNKKIFSFDVLAGMAGLIAEANFIDSDTEAISQLHTDERNGKDITADLEALGLNLSAFRYIVDTMLSNDEPDKETWNNLYHICIQAYKNRKTSNWIGLEASIVLSPDHFRLRSEEAYEESRTFYPWRTGFLERVQWVEKLKDRDNAISSVVTEHLKAVDEVDTICLVDLKNDLIELSGVNGSSLEVKTETLSNSLLIDLKDNAGRKSTHVALAIETLQALVWRIRTGQLYNDLTTLTYVGGSFDEEWKWRSSYKTWKSAQFVNLFPENVLLPEIKPNQTYTYQKIVETLSNSQNFSPKDACALSNDYAEYLRDISNFDQVVGTYSFFYEGIKDPCGHYNPTGVDESMDDSGLVTTSTKGIPVIYFFGLNKASGKIYYCIYRYEDEAKSKVKGIINQSLIISEWRVIEDVIGVIELSACISYPKQFRAGGSLLPVQRITAYYLLDEKGAKKPASVSLDLKKNDWLKPKNIKLPSDLSDQNIKFFVADDYHSETKLVASSQEATDHYYSCFIDGLTGEVVKEWKKQGPHKLRKWRYIPDEWVIIDLDLFYKVIAAAGKVILYQGKYLHFQDKKSFDDLATGLFFLSFHDFMFQAETGSTKNLLVELNPSHLENPVVESFMRYQDSDTEYLVIFRGENGDAYFNHVQLKVTSWQKGYISSTIKNQGIWRSQDSIHSVIYSPESQDDILFDNGSNTNKLLASAIKQTDSGDYTFTKVVGLLNGGGEITKAGILPAFRKITPRSKAPSKVVRRNGLFKSHPLLGSRDFLPSLRPVGEDSIDRTNALRKQSSSFKLRKRNTLYPYFEEAYYYLPMLMADKLQRNGHFKEALDWYRLVYDYSLDEGSSKIYPLLLDEENKSDVFSAYEATLADPTNPHALAKQRSNAFTRYTLAAIARCFIEFADEEFTIDTGESLTKAFSLYEKGIQVLEEAGYNSTFSDAEVAIAKMDDSKTDHEDFKPWLGNWKLIKNTLYLIQLVEDLEDVITFIEGKLSEAGSLIVYNDDTIGAALKLIIAEIEKARRAGTQSLEYDTIEALTLPDFTTDFSKLINEEDDPFPVLPAFLYGTLKLNYTFGIPRNPVKDYLAMYAEVNLFKLRNSMNIAGMVRNLEAYSISPDSVTGLTYIGIGGQMVTVGATFGATTSPYHYKVILERSKQLAQMAGQMENAMMNALERYDAETYSLKRAEQDLALAEESIYLQDLRLDQAELGVTLAKKQYERADVTYNQMADWMSVEFGEFYRNLIDLYGTLMAFNVASSLATATASAISANANAGSDKALLGISAAAFHVTAGGLNVGANITNHFIQVENLRLSDKQNKRNWNYQKNLAEKDKEIAKIQEDIARSQTRVVGQEKRMATLQRDFAESTSEFLANKFTNADLHRWMGQILQGVYAYFLKQATNMAQQASQQMAFELQERVPVSLQADYWKKSSNSYSQSQEGQDQDRKGLTGSARLLQDIYKLDQYAFDHDKRKLELNKTLSLASLFPFEFQQFKETGVLRFSTDSDLFDRDFPGHYLRLIKQVKVNVIALIPPSQGIKSTLVNNGISKVVTGGKGMPFVSTYVLRQPDTIALTGSNAANGLFEMVSVYRQEKLLPFEGLGVDTNWEFTMPKASNFFDYQTIADVIFTLDYTAKHDFLYEKEVKSRLDTKITSQIAMSFKNNLPDQWFDLTHPEETDRPMSVSFDLYEQDFPANVKDMAYEEIFLKLSSSDDAKEEHLLKVKLSLTNASATIVDQKQTNRDNSLSSKEDLLNFSDANDKSPIGRWTLEFPPHLRVLNPDEGETDSHQDAIRLLKDGTIDDIILIIAFHGQTPAW